MGDVAKSEGLFFRLFLWDILHDVPRLAVQQFADSFNVFPRDQFSMS